MTTSEKAHENAPDGLTEGDAVRLVAEACRILGKLELTHSSLGHVSYRCGEDTMLIKGKGPAEAGLRYTTEEDILEVDFDAEKVSGPPGLQPPSESFLHIWLYKLNPEVRSVVHVHPETAVLLTVCEKPILPIYGAYGPGVTMAVEGVPVYPRSVRIRDHRLGEDFARFMGPKRYALMRGHGVSVAGSSVEEAIVRTLTLNEVTSMTYKAYLLGDPKPIPPEDIEEYSKPPEEHRTRGSAGGTTGMLASYRYYRRLAGESD
jgi:ribulose-5-phosphate 4-epimerase/fuculose-1-phosphate aldolase